MSWLNSFAYGPLTVNVRMDGATTPTWTGVLSLSSLGQFSDPVRVGVVWTVAVDGNGALSLTGLDGDTAPSLALGSEFDVEVEPPTVAQDVAVASATLANSSLNASACFTDLGGTKNYPSPGFTSGTGPGPLLPNPVDFGFSGGVAIDSYGIDVSVTATTTPANGLVLTFTPQYSVPTPPPPPPQCEEIGNVTRAKVSAYQRARVHHSRLVRGEVRCLIADFNGAIPAGRTIASVTWRCEQPYYVGMANANLQPNLRATGVTITAQLQGWAWLKCEATLDNGELYTQVFTVLVMATPYFYGEAIPTLGPYTLTATAS